MKRLHLHVNVEDLAQSVRFYETLFGVPPAVLKGDYAKWMLEDPRVTSRSPSAAGPPGSTMSASRPRPPPSWPSSPAG